MMHYHHCPECYEHAPCWDSCTLVDELEDDGRKFGNHVACNDCSFALICPAHGKVLISPEEYREQLNRANARWKCWCGLVAAWDDAHEERKMERDARIPSRSLRIEPMRGLPRVVLAPLFPVPPDRFGACTRCGVCLRLSVNGGRCTVCSGSLVAI